MAAHASALVCLHVPASQPSRELRIAAAFTVQHCSRNEANKTLLRELSAFAALVQMLAYTASVEEHVAALSATARARTTRTRNRHAP
eukprot:5537966-Pleurochrysis_carterae.AAC.2